MRVVDRRSLQSPYIFEFYDRISNAVSDQSGIERIESIRHELCSDDTRVGGRDFGAGTQIVKTNRDYRISDIAKKGISSRKDCILLYELVEFVKPKVCIELGTSLGIATAYLSHAAGPGRVVTFEGNKFLLEKAQAILDGMSCGNVQIIQGNIDERLPEFLAHVDHIDFAIIDANHTEKALVSYFDLLKKKISPQGMIVVDDIRWSKGMNRGWQKVRNDPVVTLSIESMSKGLLIFDPKLQKQHFVLSL